MKIIIIFFVILTSIANATEIYFWVDEKSIKHYEAGPPSQKEIEREKELLRASGDNHFVNENYRRAIDNYLQAKDLYLSDANFRYKLGLSYVAIGDIQKAKDEYQILERLDTKLAEGLRAYINNKAALIQSIINQEMAEQQRID